MNPIHFKGQQAVLGAPEGWDESQGKCLGLPVLRVSDSFISFWKPTWRERIALLFGAKVQLTVVAAGHPPVAVDINRIVRESK
jgi:hypothetical protein